MIPPLITSRHNLRVKEAAKLRDRRQREKQRRIVIDGAREIARALASGIRLEEVFVCEALCTSAACQVTLEQLQNGRANLLPVTPEVFAKIAYGDRAEGLVAIAATPQHTLADFHLPPRAVVAVLEGVEKPGNLGAVLRSADGAGLAALIVTGAGAELYNPNTIRASLGTIFHLPVCTASTDETLDWLRAQQAPIFAARLHDAIDYTAADFSHGAAIVLGSEAHGLSPAWQAPDITGIRLPMLGLADSLNVSAAGAVLFYEALRQRNLHGPPKKP